MTELDRLPPDQRAVLSLVLDRGKSYAEVASMLSIPEQVVRDRAHAALDALARVAGADGSTATAPMPSAANTPARSPTLSAANTPARSPAPAVASPPPRAPISNLSARPATPAQPSSRLGGALLLGGIVVAIVVAVILLSSGGGKSSGAGSSSSSTPASTSSSSSTGTSSAAKPRIDKKLTLSPLEPGAGGSGEAYVLSDGARHAFYVAAKGLPASRGFFYAVWLYNSPSSSAPLGRSPSVGSDGRLEGGGPLPSNASNYAKLIVTRETSTHTRHPGTIVLSGNFALR
jgi:hypothetical protein